MLSRQLGMHREQQRDVGQRTDRDQRERALAQLARDQLDGVDRLRRRARAAAGRGRRGPSRRGPRWPTRRVVDQARGRRPRRPGCACAPATSSTRMALAVTLSSVWFPATVVTATSSSSGLATREQEGHRVVVARVAVDDHRRRHGASSWRVACSNAAMQIAALLLSAVLAQAAPAATTGAAESMTTGSAVVTGTVNPGGEATTYQFEYGTSTSYGLTTPPQDAGSGTDPVAVRATLTGPDDQHDLPLPGRGHQRRRRRARRRPDASAPARPPRRRRSPAARRRRVNALGATLNASVNPRGLATTVRFEYGTSTVLRHRARPIRRSARAASTVSVTAAIGGLQAEHAVQLPRRRDQRGRRHARRQPHFHDRATRRPAWPSRPRRSARSGAPG